MMNKSEWRKLYPLFDYRHPEIKVVIVTKSLNDIPDGVLDKCVIIDNLENAQ